MQSNSSASDRSGASSVTAFHPAEISARSAERSRRLSVPREPVGFAPGWALALVSQEDTESWAENGSVIDMDIRIDGETARLRTVWPVFEKLLHEAEPGLEASDLDAELFASFLESHLIDAVEKLEALLGVACAFVRVAPAREIRDQARLDLALTAGRAQEAYPAALFGSPRLLGLLASVWERRPVSQQSQITPTFILSARVAYSSLSRAALQRLAVGDGLMFDRVAPESGVVLSIADHVFTCAQITAEGGFEVKQPFTTNSPLLLGEFSMLGDEDQQVGAAALEDTTVGSLPVHIVFEIGRKEMTLDELREIGVGAPVSLDRPASEAVDIIANGRRIGAGEMIIIGDQIGVRITRLNGNA